MKDGGNVSLQMPDLLVYAKALLLGFVGAEIFRLSFYLGERIAPCVSEFDPRVKLLFVLAPLILCAAYFAKRDGISAARRLSRSRRFDLLIAVALGVCVNFVTSPLVDKIHGSFQTASPWWAPTILGLLLLLLASPIVRAWCSPKETASPLYFLADDEIDDQGEDVLAIKGQAESFAHMVLASSSHPSLVFGVDGPWGVGKTSFINLAEKYWEEDPSVIVFRFEPLRYAADSDLTDRFIRDLSSVIQKEVFAPEFKPIASRYSRILKGKTDFSFLGFKLSLEPSSETADELLEEIDQLLTRLTRRVIVVIDDLDRLEPKSVNNVLFTARRTFRLTRASYILCYDTEVLAGGKDEGERAREFLEKFVTIKLSLFVDSTSLSEFLRRDWHSAENKLGSIPADTMIKLASVLETLAEILDSEDAARYLPLVGDMRKIKRFVNAVLLMQMEKTNLGRTDFNRRDLVNLILLHLSYPGLFRRVYAEETGFRSGAFSVKRAKNSPDFSNSSEFEKLAKSYGEAAEFIVRELFDVQRLKLANKSSVEEGFMRSRACFNEGQLRNLESYLKLIVRLYKPDPRTTLVLYRDAVDKVRDGTSISKIFEGDDFAASAHAQDQFWRVLVSQSYDFTQKVADDAINTLVDYIPRYSSLDRNDRGLRQRSVYSLLRLLDRAGWGRMDGKRQTNSPENVVEVAHRIFGEDKYQGRGLIARLADPERGVLGWNDLALFRLCCSADRQGQLHNLESALIVHGDLKAERSGLLTDLAREGMRLISQQVFEHFRRIYIEPKRNFLADVNRTSDQEFLGLVRESLPEGEEFESGECVLLQGDQLEAVRSSVKSFVLYQLCNSRPATGSGVGCGFYDEVGAVDNGGIARQMNTYSFEVCFNPDLDAGNLELFADYCLCHLNNAFFSSGEGQGFVPTKESLQAGFDLSALCEYWQRRRDAFRNLLSLDRRVVTLNNVATYREDLPKVFEVLDAMVADGRNQGLKSE